MFLPIARVPIAIALHGETTLLFVCIHNDVYRVFFFFFFFSFSGGWGKIKL